MKLADRIVVVGGSLAGVRTIETLRERGYEGEIVALCGESEMPYDRPPLSKQFLKAGWEEDRLSLRRSGFGELEVDWRLGSQASSLDPGAREIGLAGGTSLPYGGLVLATGSSPRRLPGAPSLAGMHELRSLSDARALRGDLVQASRLVVIGAGFIGMEVAASARELGLEVTVVEALPTALLRGLGGQLGEWAMGRFRDHGVEIRCGVAVEGFRGDVRVEAVTLGDGTLLETDMVLVGIGVGPSCAWAENAGLDLSNGILCDGTGATPLPDVVAVGDVARWHNPAYGEAIRYEHWTSAVEQSSVAAERLLAGQGTVKSLAQVPYVWSDFFDLRLAIAGDVSGSDRMHVCQGGLDEEHFLVLFGREGKLCAAVGIKRPRPLNACRELIREGVSFDEALEAFG
jgi:NADPH-dependent 2,4-dienoyl-CoA reductase/sulfur reductase-like enzyme